MPVGSYLELNTPRHVKLTTDASDHTRYIRLSATVAPYIGNGVNAAPTLGWKSNEIAAGARIATPIFGNLKAFLPGRG